MGDTIIAIPTAKYFFINGMTYFMLLSMYLYFLNNFKLKKIWLAVIGSLIVSFVYAFFLEKFALGYKFGEEFVIFLVENIILFITAKTIRVGIKKYLQTLIIMAVSHSYCIFAVTIISSSVIKAFNLNSAGASGDSEFTWGAAIFCVVAVALLLVLFAFITKIVVQWQRRYIPKKVLYFVVIIMILLAGTATIIHQIINIKDSWIAGIITISISVILFFAFAVYMNATVKEQKYHNELQNQKNLELYMRNLEQNYDEVRKFRHDIKNVLLALNLQIQETGDKNLIANTKKLLANYNFDSVMSTDLDKFYSIKNSLIKGLVFGKYLACNDKKIDFNLESNRSVLKRDVQYFDEFRILGIFLDNAIEAAELTNEPRVTLSITEENDAVTMMVINSCAEPVDVASVFDNGYTTKGEDRGLGLTMVKEIMNNNPNILISVHFDNNKFIATMTSNKKG